MPRTRSSLRIDDDGQSDDEITETSAKEKAAKNKRQKRIRLNDSSLDIQNDDNDQLINNCVQYLLIADQKKLPIKRADIFKHVMKDVPNTRRTQEGIIDHVKQRLENVFAMKLIECGDDHPNCFIIINALSSPSSSSSSSASETYFHQFKSDDLHYRTGLLIPILAMIFMNGGTVRDADLYKFVNKLGFDVESKRQIKVSSEANGNTTVKKLLTEYWTRQLYLKYQKVSRSEPPVHEFSWGFRADHEFTKMNILEFVSTVYGNGTKPEFWRRQYNLALNDANTSADGTDNSTMETDIN